ncbi:MAG TPA: hypothetical protein VE591_04655, partial [Candidatus Acidoferrum sp.]|nr:hypothetical protein [Candidatus Acidoferrum sp.]
TPAAVAPTSAPQTRVRGVPLIAPAKQKISWQLTPMQTYFNGSNINTKTTLANGVGFQFGYDLTNRITAYWNRTPNDSLQENVIGSKPNQPGLDLVDEIGAAYKLTSNWNIALESYHRWRQCCPGAGDPTNPNPVAERGVAALTNYAFGPNTIIGKPFSATFQYTEWSHHLNAFAAKSLPKGIQDEGNKPTTTESLAWRIPIFHQRKFVPFVSVQELGTTYFDNSAMPTYADVVNYGANIIGSRLVSYTISFRNLNEHQQGYPFAFPNVQHYTWLILAANFHGRL